MNYFKIIKDLVFIGVATSYDFRRYQLKHKIILVADENTAEYIQINDSYYRDNWMKPIISNDVPYLSASIISISKEEYESLYEAIENNEQIDIEEQEQQIPEEPEIPQEEQVTVAFAKESKIKEMSNKCEKTITNGIDLVLSDGESHHFSLRIEDQVNLLSISFMLASGTAETISYHADDEYCKEYSLADMNMIVEQAIQFKTFHVTYFNSLKFYINSLRSISKIQAIEYGIEIPEKYQSDELKNMLAQMTGVNNES